MDGLKVVNHTVFCLQEHTLWYLSGTGLSHQASAKASAQLCNSTLCEEVYDINTDVQGSQDEQAEHRPSSELF